MSAFVALPQYPDVPDAPGVPTVPRAPVTPVTAEHLAPLPPNAPITPVTSETLPPLLKADAPGVNQGQPAPRWGIFDQKGNPVIVSDGVVSVGYKKDFRVPDFPIEQGGFGTYNKVATPFAGKVTFIQGGMDSDRTDFLSSVDDACKSLSLYNLVTPEVSYSNVNVTHYDYHRTDKNGVTLLSVDVWVQEIRVTAAAQFSSQGTTTPGTQAQTTPDPNGSGGGTAPVTGTPIAANSQQTQSQQPVNPQNPASNNPSNDGITQPTYPTPEEWAAIQNQPQTNEAGLTASQQAAYEKANPVSPDGQWHAGGMTIAQAKQLPP